RRASGRNGRAATVRRTVVVTGAGTRNRARSLPDTSTYLVVTRYRARSRPDTSTYLVVTRYRARSLPDTSTYLVVTRSGGGNRGAPRRRREPRLRRVRLARRRRHVHVPGRDQVPGQVPSGHVHVPGRDQVRGRESRRSAPPARTTSPSRSPGATKTTRPRTWS